MSSLADQVNNFITQNRELFLGENGLERLSRMIRGPALNLIDVVTAEPSHPAVASLSAMCWVVTLSGRSRWPDLESEHLAIRNR